MFWEPRVLVDDDGLLVVDKPSGLPSTGRNLDDPNCLQSWLMARYRRRRIWAVHQLDANTSGLNLFVKRKALVSKWTTSLRAGVKTYRAFVAGRVETDQQTVDMPLGFCERTRRRRVLSAGQPAVSHITVVSRFSHASEVLVRIDTGRTHQVRLHLEAIGHPIVGDVRYAPPDTAAGHTRHALHAERLQLGARRLHAPLPADLRALRDRLLLGEC